MALAVYNRLAFGSVFTLSSAHERKEQFRIMASEGLFGIGLPQIGTLLHLVLDPSKELLVFSPIVLLAAARLPRARRAMTGRQFCSLVVTPLALIILYAGYPNWHGGWTVGARYLVPTLPFLLFPLVFAAGSWLESLALESRAHGARLHRGGLHREVERDRARMGTGEHGPARLPQASGGAAGAAADELAVPRRSRRMRCEPTRSLCRL